VDDDEIIEIALIENIQRKDLTAFEEAEGFLLLQQKFGYTHEKISHVIGKSRTTITEGIVLLCLSASAVVAIAALYWTVKAWFHRWTTETDVTNLRVVHKSGFIKRRTFEMSLDKVESVDVNQSILGRILNYGSVTVRGVGEGSETIDSIASPLEFRNHITAR
jgi:uncharacterized membrane protein YdbT with pleckstrin-like domain